jgi:hypothetical protein
LTWIDSITSAESGNDSWVEIASYTDLEKADFAFMIVPDGVKPEDKDEEMNKERVFIPLPGGKSFTQIGSAQDFLQFNHKDYVSTGNTVRLVCPECRAGFKITLLHKKGRSIDIQLCDIKDSPTRKAVEEMKSVFPGWRYDDLRAVIKKYNGGLREAMEEVKSKNAGLA